MVVSGALLDAHLMVTNCTIKQEIRYETELRGKGQNSLLELFRPIAWTYAAYGITQALAAKRVLHRFAP